MEQTSIPPEFITRLPKAELHLHLEGSISPRRLRELSRRYETELKSLSEEEIAETLFKFEDFHQFLECYRTVCQHLRGPDDYLLLLDDLFDYFQENRILYAEVIYTPSIPWKLGWDGAEILDAILKRSEQLTHSSGVEVRWILDCVRQFGASAARETAELAVQCLDRGVVALGLGGDEKSVAAREYEEVFAWARAQTLFVHIHAGEVGEPEQIWDALKILGANRIGHGIQAARDPRLMDYLREHAIGLDVCLTSNAATGAWRPISENPFWLLNKRGVPVTLNTDDPGIFRTTLVEEYEKAARLFRLDQHDLSHIAIQGVRSAFLHHDHKMALMQRFQDEIHGLLEKR